MDNPLNDIVEINNPEILTTLLTYCVRCPDVARAAVTRLNPEDFDPGSELVYTVIWRAAQAYWQAYGSVPAYHYTADMTQGILISLNYTDAIIQQQCRGVVDAIYSFDESQWNAEYGIVLLNAFFSQRFAAQASELAMQFSGDRAKLKTFIDREFQRFDGMSRKQMDPFDLDKNEMVLPPRVPTGCGIFDLLLGGGSLPAECYGLLGPTGGGKTTLALQIASAMAKCKRRVDIWSYEQPIRDLQPRLLSCASGVSKDKLEGDGFSSLDETTQKKVREAADRCRGHIDLIDRSTDGSDLAEIEMELRRKVDNGVKPDLVIIDWLWILLLRMESSARQEERHKMQGALEQLKRMAAKYDTNFLILHQLSTEVSKKAAGAKPQWFNSAEAGSFAWLLHYCIAIGTADDNGVCWMVGSKARNAPVQARHARLRGAFNRFDLLDSVMSYDTNAGKFVADVDKNTFPTTGKSATVEKSSDEMDYEGDYADMIN